MAALLLRLLVFAHLLDCGHDIGIGPAAADVPLISSFTDASSGPHGSLSKPTADMIGPTCNSRTGIRRRQRMPPAWEQRVGCAEALNGCDLFPIVHQARLRHEFTRRPFTCTVQAPHCPCHSPSLVPVESNGLTDAIEQRRPRVDAKLAVLAVNAQRDGTAALMFARPQMPRRTAPRYDRSGRGTSRAQKKCRRVGFDGLDGESSPIQPPCPKWCCNRDRLYAELDSRRHRPPSACLQVTS